MSAIALILLKNGFTITGSDISENDEVKRLKDLGIKIYIGHDASNIEKDTELIVFSKAIHNDNPEITEATKRNIKLISRSAILGEIMKGFKKRICVAGTHGKTTTTSIIAKIILDANIDATINVGGNVKELHGNTAIGKNKDLFVAEACEYTNSFLDFFPNIEVITNIESEHLDFFKDLADIRNSFKKFIELLPDDGMLCINNSIDDIKSLIKDTKAKIVTFGESRDSDYYFDNNHYDNKLYQVFDVYHDGTHLGTIRQKLIGKHNTLNFMGALSALLEYGVSFDIIKKGIEEFTGAGRRLENHGTFNGVTLIDDYSHHPTEIEATLEALKSLKYSKMYLIFQPHTFSRTKAFYDDFVRVLGATKHLIITKIYPAREIDTGEISGKDIIDGIKLNKNNNCELCEYIEKFEDIQEYLHNVIKEGDLIVTMGAGNVYKILNYF